MKNCYNHPEKEAISFCHGCRKEYCELCLDEGKEYYYCKKAECQNLLEKELPSYKVPETVICKKCESELELSEEERIIGKIHCPECEVIVVSNEGSDLTLCSEILEIEKFKNNYYDHELFSNNNLSFPRKWESRELLSKWISDKSIRK